MQRYYDISMEFLASLLRSLFRRGSGGEASEKRRLFSQDITFVHISSGGVGEPGVVN